MGLSFCLCASYDSIFIFSGCACSMLGCHFLMFCVLASFSAFFRTWLRTVRATVSIFVILLWFESHEKSFSQLICMPRYKHSATVLQLKENGGRKWCSCLDKLVGWLAGCLASVALCFAEQHSTNTPSTARENRACWSQLPPFPSSCLPSFFISLLSLPPCL